MAIRKHANNISTTLNGSITNVATSITLTSATGLPSIGAGEVYRLTITDGTNIEIVEVTDDASSPTLTVTRGVEGTSGTAFADLDTVELRATADSVDRKVDAITSTDNAAARYDSTAGALQDSGVIIDDSDAVTGVTSLDVDNININGNAITSTDTNGDIDITPDGTGSTNISELVSTDAALTTPNIGTPSAGTLTNCTGLPVAGAGTGRASHTAYAVVCGGTTSTGAQQSIASVGTSGQVLTSNGAGSLPTMQDAAAGGTYITWNYITGIGTTMSVNNAYIVRNNSVRVDLVLPTSAVRGDTLTIVGSGTAGWKITQGAFQQIIAGTNSSTVGASGEVASTNRYDSIQLVCITTSSEWAAIGKEQGTLTFT